MFFVFGALALAGCEPRSATFGPCPATFRPKSERLRLDVQRRTRELELMERSDLHAALLERIPVVIEREPSTLSRFSHWAARRRLGFYTVWNSPASSDAPTPFADDERRLHHPVHAIVEHARELALHGVDLLVVPGPTPVQIYPDDVEGVPAAGPAFAGVDPGTLRFFRRLGEEGVEVVDLISLFARQREGTDERAERYLYSAIDEHWTPRGVELAADAVAERIAQFAWYEPGESRAGVDFELSTAREEWTNYASEGSEPTEYWFTSVRKDGERAHAADRASPIVVLGDSFALHYFTEGANLASQLFARIGRPLDTILVPGGGGEAVWQALARRPDPLQGKRLVVWVFTSNALYSNSIKPVRIFER